MIDVTTEEQARLDRQLIDAAAAGDERAAAALCQRYEVRVTRLCRRLLSSPEDAADAAQDAMLGVLGQIPKLSGTDVAFGSYLFAVTRHACYRYQRGKARLEPMAEIPDSAVPVGTGPGGAAELSDPFSDPQRNVLLEARREEIREAHAGLPARQQEVLELREIHELSYVEIADVMGMNANSVAQLLSRARINLRDRLRGTALYSVATSSPDCEHSLALLAARDDGELAPATPEADWLDEHLQDCSTCRVARDAMAEAGVSYRALFPMAVAGLALREDEAQAAYSGAGEGTRSAFPGISRGVRRATAFSGAMMAGAVLCLFTSSGHDSRVVPRAAALAAAVTAPQHNAAPTPRKRPNRAAAQRPKRSGTLAPPQPTATPGRVEARPVAIAAPAPVEAQPVAIATPTPEPASGEHRLTHPRDNGSPDFEPATGLPSRDLGAEPPEPEPEPTPEPTPAPDPGPMPSPPPGPTTPPVGCQLPAQVIDGACVVPPATPDPVPPTP